MSGLSIFLPSSETEGPTYFPAALGEEPFDFAYFGPGSIPSDVVWRGRPAQGRFQKSTKTIGVRERIGTYTERIGT